MLTTMVYDPADRLRSFELVADLARSGRSPLPNPARTGEWPVSQRGSSATSW